MECGPVLAWLSILEHTRKPVDAVMRDHCSALDAVTISAMTTKGVPAAAANAMLGGVHERMSTLPGTGFASTRIQIADDFSYTDPISGAATTKQGIRLLLEDGSRVVLRLSGTGTEGATLRVYFESYSKTDIAQDPAARIAPLVEALDVLTGMRKLLGRDAPSVIT